MGIFLHKHNAIIIPNKMNNNVVISSNTHPHSSFSQRVLKMPFLIGLSQDLNRANTLHLVATHKIFLTFLFKLSISNYEKA